MTHFKNVLLILFVISLIQLTSFTEGMMKKSQPFQYPPPFELGTCCACTTIFDAIENKHDNCLKIILSQDPTAKHFLKSTFITPLMQAAIDNYIEGVIALINAGAPLNVRDDHGRTALMHAVLLEHEDIVRELVIRGADITIADITGASPFRVAVDNASLRCAILFLEAYDESGNPKLASVEIDYPTLLRELKYKTLQSPNLGMEYLLWEKALHPFLAVLQRVKNEQNRFVYITGEGGELFSRALLSDFASLLNVVLRDIDTF